MNNNFSVQDDTLQCSTPLKMSYFIKYVILLYLKKLKQIFYLLTKFNYFKRNEPMSIFMHLGRYAHDNTPPCTVRLLSREEKFYFCTIFIS